MARAGQEIEGYGMRLRLVRTAAETDGELLEMEATYEGPAAFHRSTNTPTRPSTSRCSRAP